MQRRAVIVGSSWLAWLLATGAAPGWRAMGVRPQDWRPQIKYVLLPATPDPSCLYSSVGEVLFVIVIGLLCCIPVELAKFRAGRFAVYMALVVFQLLIVLDVVRSYAWDWWLALLAFVITLPDVPQTHWSVAWKWPWISGAYLVAFTAWLLAARATKQMEKMISNRYNEELKKTAVNN